MLIEKTLFEKHCLFDNVYFEFTKNLNNSLLNKSLYIDFGNFETVFNDKNSNVYKYASLNFSYNLNKLKQDVYLIKNNNFFNDFKLIDLNIKDYLDIKFFSEKRDVIQKEIKYIIQHYLSNDYDDIMNITEFNKDMFVVVDSCFISNLNLTKNYIKNESI